MMPLQLSKDVSTIAFFDDGSSISIIRHDLARELGLKKEPRKEWLTFASKEPELHDTFSYFMKIKLVDGTIRNLKLLGLDQITNDAPAVDVKVAYDIFPNLPEGAVDRPAGVVGLLIGQDNSELLPDYVLKDGSLRALKVNIGSGWVLGGSHPEIKSPGFSYTNYVATYRSAQVTSQRVNLVNRVVCSCCAVQNCGFMEAEMTGINVPRRCARCLNCSQCTFQTEGRTLQEQYEWEEVRKGIRYDPDLKRVKVSYVFKGDLSQFQDNQRQMEKRAISQENQLDRKGFMADYNKVIDDYIARGVWVPVTKDELADWRNKGLPTHFVGHHCVLNDKSSSTPVRVVVDSTVKNNYVGPSLNDVMIKGPNSLNNLVEVLFRWRAQEVAMVFDLSKAYHTLVTGDLEKYMRLVVWRHGDKSKEFTVYGHEKVGMGDKQAPISLEGAKEVTADLGEHIDPEAAEKLLKDLYVDDGCT